MSSLENFFLRALESVSALNLIKSLLVVKLSISKKSNFFELLFCFGFSFIFKSSEITLAVDSSACLNFYLRFDSLELIKFEY